MGKLKLKEYFDFVQWVATPEPLRKQLGLPLTQKELAEKLGVIEPTLSVWKHDPEFREDVKREINTWARDRTTNVIAGLYQKCLKGDPFAIKIWLQYFEDFSETKNEKHTFELDVKIEEGHNKAVLDAFKNFGLIQQYASDHATIIDGSTVERSADVQDAAQDFGTN